MAQIIRRHIWHNLKVNRLNFRSSPTSFMRKFAILPRQYSDTLHDQQTTDKASLESEMSIDRDQIGRLIGARGMNIRSISKISRCNINCDSTETGDDAGKSRVSITGESEDDIAKAKQVIEEVLTNPNSFLDHELESEIPKSYIGRVIGKGGSNVINLSIRYDCRIEVSKEVQDEDGNVKVKFIGEEGNCKAARSAVFADLGMTSGGSQGHEVSLLIPSHLFGFFIGRAGIRINTLRPLTRCELVTNSEQGELDDNDPRTLLIRGDEADCEDARIVITTLMKLFERHRTAGDIMTEIPRH